MTVSSRMRHYVILLLYTSSRPDGLSHGRQTATTRGRLPAVITAADSSVRLMVGRATDTTAVVAIVRGQVALYLCPVDYCVNVCGGGRPRRRRRTLSDVIGRRAPRQSCGIVRTLTHPVYHLSSATVPRYSVVLYQCSSARDRSGVITNTVLVVVVVVIIYYHSSFLIRNTIILLYRIILLSGFPRTSRHGRRQNVFEKSRVIPSHF